jgi:cell division protein ZapB
LLTAFRLPTTIAHMDSELAQLESRVEQLIGLYEAGKAEARELRMRVTALEAENRRLGQKVATAAERLEALLERLPED